MGGNIYDEVVSRLVVERGHRRFELLRADAERRLRCGIVVLIVKRAARWKFRRWQTARVAVAIARSDGKLRRVSGRALLTQLRRVLLCERKWNYADDQQ